MQGGWDVKEGLGGPLGAHPSPLPTGCVSDTGGVIPERQNVCSASASQLLLCRGVGGAVMRRPPLGKSYGLELNVIFNVPAMRSLYLPAQSCRVVSSASLLCETPVCIEFSIVA